MKEPSHPAPLTFAIAPGAAQPMHWKASVPAAAILILLAVDTADAEPSPPPDEIIVTAVRSKCVYSVSSKPVSDRAFDEYAKGWALGRPVRVITPRSADLRCLAKITFKLADRGVRLIEFVDPADDR